MLCTLRVFQSAALSPGVSHSFRVGVGKSTPTAGRWRILHFFSLASAETKADELRTLAVFALL